MNQLKSARYHRAQRRAAGATLVASALLLAALLVSGGSVWLRDAVNGSVAAYTLALAALVGAVLGPVAWYRSYRLDRRYELSRASLRVWMRDQLKACVVTAGVAVAGAEIVYAAIRWSPTWWWLIAAAGATAIVGVFASAGPVLLLPLFNPSRPLSREALRRRLMALSNRAGVPALDVHEWNAGGTTRRANAALVGAGVTRRILLSDTLLDNYTDDEIEVVLAHEIGHHVHRDMLLAIAAELIVLTAGFRLAAAAIDRAASWLRFSSPADVASLPLVLLAVGTAVLLATPALNALSRYSERRADRFALRTASRPAAFIDVVRRMAAQNLAEERPSRAARWLFHTHPPVEERIERARRALNGAAARNRPESQSSDWRCG